MCYCVSPRIEIRYIGSWISTVVYSHRKKTNHGSWYWNVINELQDCRESGKNIRNIKSLAGLCIMFTRNCGLNSAANWTVNVILNLIVRYDHPVTSRLRTDGCGLIQLLKTEQGAKDVSSPLADLHIRLMCSLSSVRRELPLNWVWFPVGP